MDTRTKEAVRYLGYGRSAVDERTLNMIQESFHELEQIAEVKVIYRIFELTYSSADDLSIGKMKVKSKSLYRNLKGCDSVVLFAVTLGAEVDRMMRKYEFLDMAKAVVFQASAAAFLEEFCDKIQTEIEVELKQSGKYLRPRFSPGYGDFSVLHQRDILEILETAKVIGLGMTDSYMLTPTKSVTAVIGVSNQEEGCHKRGCEVCTKTDCLYRRS